MRTMICLLTMTLVGVAAQAQIPQLLSYQGKLLNSVGAPVPDGSYAMEFRFYDDCLAGTLLLTDNHAAVQTRNGIYSVLLGGGTLTPGGEPDLLSVFQNHDVVCLGVKVGTDVEMQPRQQIVSSGFAMRSAVTDGATPGSGMVNSADDVIWTGVHNFQDSVVFADGHSLAWPHETGSPPPDVSFRVSKFNALPPGQSSHPNGEADEQWMVCYNCMEGNTLQEDLSQHAWNQKIEATYWDGVTESLEYNWNYTSPTGLKWRPFAFRLFIDGLCSNDASFCVDDSDCGVGNTCDGANTASFSWNSRSGNEVADFELVRGTGRARFRRGLEGFIEHDGANGGAGSLIGFQLFSTITTSDSAAGPVFGITVENSFESTADDAQLSDMLGVRAKNIFTGAASGRDVTGKMIVLDAWNTIDQTGANAPTADEVYGLRYRFQPTGQNATVMESNGVRVDLPDPLNATDPIVIERHFGLRILDQRGMGTIDGDALAINAQSTNPDPSRGNLSLRGGGWDDGHLRLEDGHIWLDKPNNSLRFKDGAPTSESDGYPLHSPPGTDSNWGGVYWGSSASADQDSGDEVCALAQLACKETYDMGASTPTACDSSAHSTPSFLALCY